MIYFISHTEYIKIGYTADIVRRLTELQTSCPIKMSVLGLIEGEKSDEVALHERFSHLSSHGEWFHYSSEIEDFINKLDKSLVWKYGLDPDDHIKVPNIIKKCRLESNMSVANVAAAMGISKKGVRQMEIRSEVGSVSVKNLIRVLDILGYEYQQRAIKKNHNFTQ
jgi:DNA-binding transcriptional regulator YiaG